jgi:ribosomal protein S8
MSHDIVADCLNMVMNVKKAGKSELELSRYSKLLLKVLDIAKKNGYLDYKMDNKKLKIEIKKLNRCKAIKPRFYVQVEGIEKYMRRFLPARGFGILLLSTSKGLLTQEEAYGKNIGGSLIAYFY